MKSLHLCRLQTLNKSQIVAFECEKYPGSLPGFFFTVVIQKNIRIFPKIFIMNRIFCIALIMIIPVFLLINAGCKENGRTYELEMSELNNFILSKESEGFDVDTTLTGIFYIRRKAGDGPLAQTGDTCYIEYQCYLLNNKLVETSRDYDPDGIWDFILTPPKMIMGLSEGIKLMNKNCEMDIIVPSNLAYDSQGTSSIPPYSSLIYVVKMTDLRIKK